MDDETGDEGEEGFPGDVVYEDVVASRLQALGGLLTRVDALVDPELRRLGVSALEKGIRTIPTGRSAKILTLAR